MQGLCHYRTSEDYRLGWLWWLHKSIQDFCFCQRAPSNELLRRTVVETKWHFVGRRWKVVETERGKVVKGYTSRLRIRNPKFGIDREAWTRFEGAEIHVASAKRREQPSGAEDFYNSSIAYDWTLKKRHSGEGHYSEALWRCLALPLHIDLCWPGSFIDRRIPEIKMALTIDWAFCLNHSHFRRESFVLYTPLISLTH